MAVKNCVILHTVLCRPTTLPTSRSWREWKDST